MNKRVILIAAALLSLMAGFAQLRETLSITVHRFLDERDDYERLMRSDRTGTAAESYSSQFAPTRIINGEEMIDAFIGIDNKAVIHTLRAHGVIVNCEFDDFVTAQVPVAKLTQVSNLEGVTDIEISRIMELCTDTTLKITHAGQVINGTDYGLPQGYDGSGVIIGIIDNGFDYQHLAFRCADDTSRTRIVRVYDPLDSTGHIATIGNNVLPGSIFMGEQIDTLTNDSRDSSHGTHTASIAAGMHVGGYGGMAPGAEIVMCSSRNLNLGLSEVEVVNCIKYIYSYADSVGKPCVISVSVSTYHGPHDGSDRISKAVAQTTGPGRIFVIAAGNNGNRNLYTCGMTRRDKQINMLIGQEVSGTNGDNTFYYKNVWFDTWGRDKNVRPLIRFHILDKQTQHIVWQSELVSVYKRIDSSQISKYFSPDYSEDSVGYMSALISLSSSNKYEIQCYLTNLKCNEYTVNESGRFISRYAIGVSIYPPSFVYSNKPDSCYIDSWMCKGVRIVNSKPVFIDEVDENGDTVSSEAINNFYNWPIDYCSIGSYAVHDSIISAGAYVGRNSFYSLYRGSDIVDNSHQIGHNYNITSYQVEGFGPTGAALPTITAPGFLVVAAGSRYSNFGLPWHLARSMIYNGHVWGAMSGTSMAAPTVAGIIAQWLQAVPSLSPGDVKNIIAHTAIKDAFTQSPDIGFRFGPNGKIDAMAGIQYLLSLQESEPLMGDVNDDGYVNVTDVTRLIAYLANTVSEDETYVPDGLPLNPVNADFNQDGLLNITDVILIIGYIINTVDQTEDTL